MATARKAGTLNRPSMTEAAAVITAHAQGLSFGGLPALRKKLKGLSAVRSTIFDSLTINEEQEYAFHFGGRKELQFNFGYERFADGERFRYGVAFSLVPSQSVPRIDLLYPKIERFNAYLTLKPEAYADLLMWHWTRTERSGVHRPRPVAADIVLPGHFIFLGDVQPSHAIEVDKIVETFDRLMALYEYVEGDAAPSSLEMRRESSVTFSPGFSRGATRAEYTRAERTISMDFLHGEIQHALCKRLAKKYGRNAVRKEQPSGGGGLIDVALELGPDRYWLYEVKPWPTALSCLRAAIGQLLEYAYWGGALKAERLIVVGPAAMTKEEQAYLSELRKRFSLPLDYEQVSVRG